ncbi:MAG: hypothetical protein OHK0011_12770 [Turneriella sp.]
MSAQNRQDIFFVRRNTNRNEVHFAIETSGGKPAGHQPVYGYWQMHEKGPGVTEPITVFEQMAFGIRSQKVDGEIVRLTLTALPDREIHLEPDTTTPEKYLAHMQIAGQQARLISFYAHAEPGFLMPKVKYIEIIGTVDGNEVRERINK